MSYSSYTDKPLPCRDCGTSFLFTAGEQEFFAQKGFTNEPSRCPECRAANKSRRGAVSGYRSGDYSGSSYSSERPRREMFTATCTRCGQEAHVPFQPSGDKPVYCSSCFEQQRSYR